MQQIIGEELSAQKLITTKQKKWLIAVSLAVLIIVVYKPKQSMFVLALIIAFINCFNTIFRLTLCLGFKNKRASCTNLKLERSPKISLLIALYREEKVVNELIKSLCKINYNSFEVLFALEEDDDITLKAMPESLPSNFKCIIVPNSYPRTKPKALNYALQFSTGEIIGVLDAEDRPEENQLTKVAHFFSVNRNIHYVQGKLKNYNYKTNLLTRFFDIEYANLFEIMIPLVHKSGYPMPLSGTTNYIKKDFLISQGAWDIYNVAEDADLGLRFAKNGYKIGFVNTTTHEEAPEKIGVWLNQRSRWIKGYIQTMAVFLRQPKQLIKRLGVIELVYAIFILYIGSINYLLAPYGFLYLYFYCLKLGYGSDLNSFFIIGMIFSYVSLFSQSYLFSNILRSCAYPIYFVLHTIAAHMAVYKLIKEPHKWDKTPHGLEAPKF